MLERLSKPLDVKSTVNLGILRGEMQKLVDPPKIKPTFTFEARQESARTLRQRSGNGNGHSVLHKLQIALETQMEEQQKWTKLTSKLDTKNKQVAATVVRLSTSAKVFQGELAKRTDNVTRMQKQLQDKQDRANSQMESLRKDQLVQQKKAEGARETAERTQGALDDMEYKSERVTTRFADARKKCEDLEERVESLEINLRGNTSLSSTQRDYMQAEWQVERDHLDHFRQLVLKLEEEHAHHQKECNTLKGKVGLFHDEHKRRNLRAQAVQQKLQETQVFFEAQLAKCSQEIEAVQEDRDDWEAKTLKLAEDWEATKEESAKMNVKAGLFRQQLQTIVTNVQRLQARMLAFQDEASERYGDSDDDSTSCGRASPTSVLKAPMEEAAKEKQATSYVWQPPPPAVNPKPNKPTTNSKAVTASYKPTTTNKAIAAPYKPMTKSKAITDPYKPPTSNVFQHKSVVAPICVPAVRANHVNVKLQSTANYSKNDGMMSKTAWSTASSQKQEDPSLASKLAEVQRDVQHQKRFQQDHAIKMEQQLVRLTSKVEDLVEGSATNGGIDADQLSTLNTQIQRDVTRNTDMRELMQQMSQQCNMLSTKLEGLSTDFYQRDQRYLTMEKKLQENEARHFKQMENLRSEMERQLQHQQHVFTEKMNEAVSEMQRIALERRGSVANSSMVSLESLYPMESPKRNVQVKFVDTRGETGPNVFVPTINGNTGLSMASGIMLNKPLFQGLSTAVGKSGKQ